MQELYKAILESKKYSSLDHAVIKRICQEIKSRYSKNKDAIKAVKKQLHIIYESFLVANCYKTAYALLNKYHKKPDELAADKEISKQIMALHTSTKERIKIIKDVFLFLSKYINSDSTVTDIGCGFNPFGTPYFKYSPDKYYAYDISTESVNLINFYFRKINRLNFRAELLDAVSSIPNVHANIMLLFKLLPVLHQQKKGRAIEFLVEADYDIAIISFPIKSLTGKEKGMLSHYSSFFEINIPKQFSIIEKNIIGNELFYVIKKR